eukprot:TRINITY_DN23488_c0_g1_i12.p1 TRINITY_DN23488_c0_g1~~TRINITY_DN23488_c0_g1_i12.p1  ORF type:complete len:271 (-),score=13.36 TRINITY_DN23488_c0_g1_i12:739-1551(-)
MNQRPVNTMDNTGNSIRDWYQSIPPITRAVGTVMFATTCLYQLGILSPSWLYFEPQLVFQKFQIWRIISPLFFLGGFGLQFVFEMLWFVRYAPPLERNVFQFSPADYVVFYLFNAVTYCLVQYIYPPIGLYFFASPMIFAIMYLWSRNFPNEVVSLYGVVQIRSFYLPFAFAGITLLFGRSPISEIVGIIVGHLYYFLTVLYPQQSGGQSLIKAPQFLVQWLQRIGIGNAYYPPPNVGSGAQTQGGRQQDDGNSTGGFRAFGGQGRRLAD